MGGNGEEITRGVDICGTERNSSREQRARGEEALDKVVEEIVATKVVQGRR